jgi:SAM-dependent methyltransferase
MNLPQDQVIGFSRLVELTPDSVGRPWMLELIADGAVYREPIDIQTSADSYSGFVAAKRRKLARIEPLLRCPGGSGDDVHRPGDGQLERVGASQMRCTRCSTIFPVGATAFDFLSEDLRKLAGISDTENISAWDYDPIAHSLIDAVGDGFVLDDGCGLRNEYAEQVVNFEIVRYPTTDVLGVGERLPFADESFDAVLSIAVLEHVRDPFRGAAEISRVLKRGGHLYAIVPHLQPYHGYPHHYYNMTRQGLEALFARHLEIEQAATPREGVPIWTLNWFLNRYVAGLPREVAQRFRNLRVEDLLGPSPAYLDKDFVRELNEQATYELACTNFVIARRR